MSPVAEREGGEKGGREGGKEGKEHSPHLHLGPIPEKEDHVARGAEGPEDVIYALDVCVDDLRGEEGREGGVGECVVEKAES